MGPTLQRQRDARCFPKDETSFLQYLLFSASPAFFFCAPFPISLTLNPFYLPLSLCVCVALSLFLLLKASVANVSFLPNPPPHLIDRERSPSSKQESDASAQTYRGMRLWQRLVISWVIALTTSACFPLFPPTP